MPILPRENDVFPDDLLDRSFVEAPLAEADDESGGARQWWAAYTLPRREKDLMRRLRKLLVSHYCPLVKRRTRSRTGRVRVSHVPLFGGYVFLLADRQERYLAMTTNCVSRCLSVPDAAELMHDLRQVRQLIQLDAPLTPEARIEPGTRVRIRSGPMAGLEGMVFQRRGKDRLMVAVRFLQQGASVLLEDFQVEVI